MKDGRILVERKKKEEIVDEGELVEEELKEEEEDELMVDRNEMNGDPDQQIELEMESSYPFEEYLILKCSGVIVGCNSDIILGFLLIFVQEKCFEPKIFV